MEMAPDSRGIESKLVLLEWHSVQLGRGTRRASQPNGLPYAMRRFSQVEFCGGASTWVRKRGCSSVGAVLGAVVTCAPQGGEVLVALGLFYY